MFVSENRFILKTCGSTTLLHAIKPLLKLVHEETGMDVVEVGVILIGFGQHEEGPVCFVTASGRF